jgi:hypothetical protein
MELDRWGAVHQAWQKVTVRSDSRVVDQQLGLQRMGANLQRSHDDGRGDRSPCPSQRDSGIEPAKLSDGGGAKEEEAAGVKVGLSDVPASSLPLWWLSTPF